MVVTNEKLGRQQDRPGEVWLDPDDVRWFTRAQMQPWSYRAPGPVWRQRQRAAAHRLIGDGLDALTDAAAGVLGGQPALAGAGEAGGGLVLDVPRRPAQRTFRETRPRGWSATRKRRFATRFVPTVTVVVSTAVAAPFVLRPSGQATATEVVVAAAAPPTTLTLDEGSAPPLDATVGSVTGAGEMTELLDLEFTPAPVVSDPVAPKVAAKPREPVFEKIVWRESEAHGVAFGGHLHDGVRLPVEGPRWVTWDPVYDVVPNRAEHLYATDKTVRKLLAVLKKYSAANPEAPKVVIGDLSKKGGGTLGGHVSHQNGLDIDVYYPRLDGKLKDPFTADRVDLALSQQLVDLFVAAGAQFVFVGYQTPLLGPNGVVQSYPNHENHMHVRFRP